MYVILKWAVVNTEYYVLLLFIYIFLACFDTHKSIFT